MNQTTTTLPCPACRQRLRVPTDRGDLVLTCPVCRNRWDWSPRGEDVLYIADDRIALRDPELAEAVRRYEAFERDLARSARLREPPADLWDLDLDGPRP